MNQVAARNQVSYEVYVKDRSGRWQIHGHFSGTQKKQAEEEAKQIERANHVTGVKVIREVYNHETNSSDEYVVYETRGQGKLENAAIDAAANKRKRPVTKAAPQANRSAPSPSASFDSKSDASSSDSDEKVDAKAAIASARRKAAADEGQSIVGLALKLMIAFCMAIAIGLATMLLSAKGLEYLPSMGMNISQGFYDKANFISFTVGFLASVVPMLMTLTKKFKGRAPASQPPHGKYRRNRHAAQTRAQRVMFRAVTQHVDRPPKWQRNLPMTWTVLKKIRILQKQPSLTITAHQKTQATIARTSHWSKRARCATPVIK